MLDSDSIYKNLFDVTDEQIASNNWEENLNLLLKFQLAEYMNKMKYEKMQVKNDERFKELMKDDF